jgi:hypothetical protein
MLVLLAYAPFFKVLFFQFGLTGATRLGIAELTLSDFHPAVLNALDLNIRLNLGSTSPPLHQLQVNSLTAQEKLSIGQ